MSFPIPVFYKAGWDCFFWNQKENLLQISPVPHRSKFFNFLFQIVKWGNFAETLMYSTLCFTFASPEIQKKTEPAPLCTGGMTRGGGEQKNENPINYILKFRMPIFN